MIYIDVTHLIKQLRTGRQLVGIQRVTFHTVVGLVRLLGPGAVRLLSVNDDGQLRAAALQRTVATEKRKLEISSCIFEPAHLNTGDKVVLTEWLISDVIFDVLKKAKEANSFQVFQFSHDVIPLAVPEYFFKRDRVDFSRRIAKAFGLADVILTNSYYSKADILRLCGGMFAPGTPIHVIQLPHEFGGEVTGNNVLPPDVKVPYAMMVGSVEQRKNTHRIVAAWCKLYAKHGVALPQLVLVGKYSWLGLGRLKLMMVIGWNKLRGGPIIRLHSCDDGQLAALYRQCLFSIYVSAYEGWGLPIGESLWFGRPVVAGISSSLPEVAPGMALAVSPEDSGALEKLMEQLCFDPEFQTAAAKQIDKPKLRKWSDFVSTLADCLS